MLGVGQRSARRLLEVARGVTLRAPTVLLTGQQLAAVPPPVSAAAALCSPLRSKGSYGLAGAHATTVLCIRKDGQVCVCLHSLTVTLLAASYREAHTPSNCEERTGSSISSRTPTRLFVHAQVVVIADGQVTMGSEIIKPNVKKVRRLPSGVIGGFAGERRM